MKPSIKNGILGFEQRGFHGGRQNLKGDGYVKVEFSFNQDCGQVDICTYDKMNTLDGYYAPLSIDLEHAKLLRDWLNYQIERAGNA